MNELIIELITSRGESLTRDIKIPGVGHRAMASTLLKMTTAGVLSRRLVETSKRPMWAYRIIDTTGPYLLGEPDYAYYLRTLGKHDECESC